MELFTYLMAKNDHNTSVKKDLFSYLLGKNQSGTYTDYSGTSLSINNTKKAKMKVNLLGNTSQTGTPTPDNPIPVNVVSGDNEVVVTGKNILDLTNGTYSNNGITAIVNNGEITLNGKATGGASVIVIDLINVIASSLGTLTKSLNPTGTYTGIQTSLRGSDKSNVGLYTDDASNRSETLTGDAYYLRIQVNENVSVNCTLKAQVELGSTATSYEPYQSSTYPINLPVENLFTNNIYNDLDVSSSATLQENGYYLISFVSSKTLLDGEFKPNTQYTISCMAYGSNNANCGVLGFNYTDSTSEVKAINQTTPFKYIFTSAPGKTIQSIKVTYGSYKDTYIKDLQLEPGTKANHYTPYGTTPIEMCDINDNRDKFIRNSGKNLFDESELLNVSGWSYSNNYYTGYINNLRTYMLDWQPTTYKENTRYLLKFTSYGAITTGNGRFVITYTDNTVDNISLGRTSSPETTYFITDEGKTVSRIDVDYSSGHIIYITNLMLAESSEDIPYEPYGNGDWYLEKHIGKETFTGANTENWNKYTTTDSQGNTYGFNIDLSARPFQSTDTHNFALSNRFIQVNRNSVSVVDTQGIYLGYNLSLYVKIDQSLVSGGTTENFKTYLSTHNTEVYYQLVSPTYTKIEGTLKDELDAVWRAYSYKGQTNISQINNDLPFELNVSVKVGS